MLRFVLTGAPRTKKTHSHTVDMGARCPRCGRGRNTIVLPSESFIEWERAVAPQLRAAWGAAAPPGAEVRCTKCDGSGKHNGRACIGCGGTGARPQPETRDVAVAAVFWREANRGDLVGYMTALADAMETAGVVANDRQIVSWDGTRMDKDAKHPRVEVVMEVVP